MLANTWRLRLKLLLPTASHSFGYSFDCGGFSFDASAAEKRGVIEIDRHGNVIVSADVRGTYRDPSLSLHERLSLFAETLSRDEQKLVLEARDRLFGADSAVARRDRTQQAWHNNMNTLRQRLDNLEAENRKLKGKLDAIRAVFGDAPVFDQEPEAPQDGVLFTATLLFDDETRRVKGYLPTPPENQDH
jgi:hypothetical protein